MLSNGDTGTELQNIFEHFGFASCERCMRMVESMNKNSPDWTRGNIEMILDTIQETATERNLPFSRTAVRPLIHLAIRRAERNRKDGNFSDRM